MVDAITLPVPTLVIIASRVRREEHPTRTETPPEFYENATELVSRDMKERRVRKHTIKIAIRKIQSQKILVPHFNTRLTACHLDKSECPIEPNRVMPPL